MEQGPREEWMCSHAERVIRFDTIRVCKLYELMQYTLLTIPLAWMGSSFVTMFLKKYAAEPDKYSVGQLIFSIFLSVLMIVIFAYYIPKLVVVIPFLAPYQGSGYEPSKKDEAMIGVSMATGLFFFGSLPFFGSIVTNISERIYPFGWLQKPTTTPP